MVYYVIELQTGETGAVVPMAYNNRDDAEQKYHEVLSYAAKSTVPIHSAVLMDHSGFVLKHETYVHSKIESESEEE